MSWFHAARARVRLIFGGDDAEARMNEEIGFHVDMEADRLQREEGLDPAEARRRAVLAFGGVEAHKEELRHTRPLAWLGGMKLDLKLGLRMLVKYPGLTLVGGLAMAFAIWLGAVTFVLIDQVMDPELPLPDGDRVVRIVNWDAAEYGEEMRSLNDFGIWQDELTAVTDMGAYRDVSYNLIVERDAGPVAGAEISASAFDIAPDGPLLGRTLEPSDELPGADPVVVIGHDVWRERFAGDPAVVGRTVQLDETFATVVGVMPEGFGFPVSHELWTPLRANGVLHAPRQGPAIEVFGRLAPGATLERAQVELDAIAQRLATTQPHTHEHLRAHVVPYTEYFPSSPMDEVLMASIDVFAVMLLIIICSNVALLMFARAASRENELVVRSALGATRRRIIVQLFAEALVLGAVAAAVGLGLAHLALGSWGVEFLEQNRGALPFWYDISLSPVSVAYALGLTVLGAAIAGIIPARKITRGLATTLRASSAGGGGVRFGGVWTAVIVLQVALTVAFPVIAYAQYREGARIRSQEPGFASEQYVGVTLDMDAADESETPAPRFASAVERLRERVAAEPEVAGVTFVDRMPRDYHRSHWIELDQAEQIESPAVTSATIDPSYFDVLRVPVLQGRAFTAADVAADAHVVIVDETFVEKKLQGRNAIGRRIRFSPYGERSTDESRPWYEIVGVVPALGMQSASSRDVHGGVYMAGRPGAEAPVNMMIHALGDPLELGPRIHQLAADVDPTLRVSRVLRADQVSDGFLWIIDTWFRITLMVTAVVLLLSLAGIYAVLSFTVVRRTREIGVRVALGASPRRVATAIFRKPLRQVTAGIAIGFVLVTLLAWAAMGHRPDGAPRVEEEALRLGHVGVFAIYAAVMLGVCLLACIVPTMRALRIQPAEALRAE